MSSLAPSTVAAAKAVEPVMDESGQGALALLLLIAIVGGWLALRAAVRRLRQDHAPRA